MAESTTGTGMAREQPRRRTLPVECGVGRGRTVRVVVTGGAGFIGSHLVEALLARGCTVTVVDNLHRGRRTHLASCLDHPTLRFVEGDIRDQTVLDDAFREVEVVYHLAAPGGAVQRDGRGERSALFL